MKRILLQGSTGSIGLSALAVIREQREHFKIAGLSAGHKEEELLSQARTLRPESIALLQPVDANLFIRNANELGIRKVYAGEFAFQQQAEELEYDVLLNAVMGAAGVRPTLTALKLSKNVALANKETLVAAGEIVMRCARENQAAVLPIDSEHSAIQQCLIGERSEKIRKLWLTTSGGPFWGRNTEELARVTPREALSHPTWAMGPKITVDSATLFNKGLEVIEACHLFDCAVSKVGVVRQRESIVHSMVEFVDGSFKAQLSVPDMCLPILYALSYPDRFESSLVETNPGQFGALNFDEIEVAQHPCLAMAFDAISEGGTAPAIVSAADEIAVRSFLNEGIAFLEIAEVIRRTRDNVKSAPCDSLETVMQADAEARRAAAHAVDLLVKTRRTNRC